MEAVLRRRVSARFVGGVAGVATHVERGVAAALLRHIESGLVAGAAEVLFRIARCRFEELEFVVAGVGIVASETVANRRGMHRSLYVRCLLVCVAGKAKRGWGGGDELNAGDVFVDTDFVAACAACGHGGVNGLAFVFTFMALEALGRVGVLVEGDGVHGGAGAHGQQSEHDDKGPYANAQTATMARDRDGKAVAMEEKSHSLRI